MVEAVSQLALAETLLQPEPRDPGSDRFDAALDRVADVRDHDPAPFRLRSSATRSAAGRPTAIASRSTSSGGKAPLRYFNAQQRTPRPLSLPDASVLRGALLVEQAGLVLRARSGSL